MADQTHWHDRTLLLGVTGGVAAYKVADLASRWTQRGAKVRVRMTPSACRFVQPLTFEAVTRQPVTTEIWQPLGVDDRPEHIGSGDDADLFVIAPASADHLARLAQGFGDDAVCLTALAWEGPLVICPAMNDRMCEILRCRQTSRLFVIVEQKSSIPGSAISHAVLSVPVVSPISMRSMLVSIRSSVTGSFREFAGPADHCGTIAGSHR